MAKVKVCIQLVDDTSAESKTLAEIVPEGMTFDKLIKKKVASVGWANRKLVVKSAQLYDEDFKRFVDITEPFDSLVLLNMQQFEVHLNKAKRIATPLINNTMNELSRDINNLQIGGDNSFNNSRKILFCCKK
ncbi:hypothetical protein WR25_02647 [Diploscapter pachys]|uniref:Uncharacterized protein n=1 Tax=Diploscapter pachys TaxID=2018661 RepID=A0A2A2KEQ7_9BILA|nr:hypothetical protein WR25_02647 [Diploscapter pachys]